jgi:hypothetical protein
MRRMIAAVALVAQVVMVFAPMGDLCGVTRDTAPALVAAAGGAAIGVQHPGRPHDAATCPACIAQSLHAQLVSAFSLPTLAIASRAPEDLRTTFIAHRGLPTSHQSRAPPVRS